MFHSKTPPSEKLVPFMGFFRQFQHLLHLLLQLVDSVDVVQHLERISQNVMTTMKRNAKKKIEKKDKCSWTDCAPPTPMPVKPPTGPPEGCYSNDYKHCLPKSLSDISESCNKVWLPEGAQQNCLPLWAECTDDHSDCCGSAICFGDSSYAICAPEPDDDESPVSNPTKSPVNAPTAAPVLTPIPPPPTGGGNGCCSLDYKNCIDWCGSSYDSCINCSNNDVTWLSNGPQSQCMERWVGCDGNPNGCCDGLICQLKDGWNACQPNLNSYYS